MFESVKMEKTKYINFRFKQMQVIAMCAVERNQDERRLNFQTL